MLPEVFITRIQSQFGSDAAALLEAIEAPAQTAVRLHPYRSANLSFDGQPVLWYQRGIQLNNRPSFITDPLWHAGAYYVQESSSMFIGAVLAHIKQKVTKPLRVLDLSAAPGGKSTLMLDVLGDDDLLVCNEPIKSRASVLVENIIRWGYHNVVVTCNHPTEWKKFEGFFDVVLVDAPCSGEGMFRKDKAARNEWSEAHVALCAARQSAILKSITPLIVEGGYLVYSTCTFNELENETQLLPLLADGFDSAVLPFFDSISYNQAYQSATMHTARFLPHLTLGEGLFVACLKKKTGGNVATVKPLKLDIMKQETILSSYIHQSEDFVFFKFNSQIHAISHKHKEALQQLMHMHVLYAGIAIGEVVKNKLLPHHSLAMSLQLHNQVPKTELELSDALTYLKKGNLHVSLFTNNGWQLVSHQMLPLGWVNVLSNRVNNYLPQSWRIIKDI